MAADDTPRGGKMRLPGAAVAAAGLMATAAAAQTPIPPSAKDFAMAAAQSDQYEIEAAQLAVVQSRNPRVRAFAQSMIDDHTRLRGSLAEAAAAADLPPPPPAMNSEQAAMLGALQGLRGGDFDKAYAHQQVLAHTQALAVEQSYADAGHAPSLQAAARAAVPVIQGHLEMAKQLSATLGPS